MKKIIKFISASLLILAWACSDEPNQVKYNENDLSVLREVYTNMGVKWPEYPCNFDNPKLMADVTWEKIGKEYRVVKFFPLIQYPIFYKVDIKPHEMTPRIGELTYLRNLTYHIGELEGEIPREIYKCPLETLILGGGASAYGGIYPEISLLANTLKEFSITGISVNIDCKEFERIFDLPKLESVTVKWTNLTGHVSARYGEQNYSYFSLSGNELTSCDPEIFHTNGTFPDLTENKIYCEVPYGISLTKRWKENQHLIDRYDMSYNSERGIGFKVMPRVY